MTHEDFVFPSTFTEQYGIQHYAILLRIKTPPKRIKTALSDHEKYCNDYASRKVIVLSLAMP